MPLQKCRSGGKPGYRWGNSGKCYLYNPGDSASEKAARDKAIAQGRAIEKFHVQSFGEISLDFQESSDGKLASWIQVFKTGKFEHLYVGKFEIKTKDLKQFVKNFNDNVQKTQPSLNLNHDRKDAAGWFTKLEVRGSGQQLWAQVEWTELGIEKVESKLYRYTSAELAFKYFDTESGDTVENVFTGCALTNYPFIKGMEPVKFSDSGISENVIFETIEKEKNMNLTELIAELAKLGIDFHDLKRKAENHGLLEENLTELKAEFESIKSSLAKVEAEKKAALTKVAELEKVQVDAQFNELAEKAMSEGKLTKAQVDGDFRELFDKMGADYAQRHVESLPKSIEGNFSGTGKGGNEGGDASDKIIAEAKAIQNRDDCDFASAMDKLAHEKPQLFGDFEKEADSKM